MGEVANRSVATPSGRISYAEAGSGPVALFVHGVLLNKHLWRHQLAELSAIRRCIAVDLLAHGDTEIAPGQDVSVTANANMLREMLDAVHIDQVDLIGNDSGGGIAQIFAALNPDRVRALTLTNCDTHDNWPPEAFKPFVDMVAGGGLRGYARVDEKRFAAAGRPNQFGALAGKGALAITIEPKKGAQTYQGMVPLSPDGLAASAETYFAQSEQLATILRLSAGPIYRSGEGHGWRAGALMVQAVPGAKIDDVKTSDDSFYVIIPSLRGSNWSGASTR